MFFVRWRALLLWPPGPKEHNRQRSLSLNSFPLLSLAKEEAHRKSSQCVALEAVIFHTPLYRELWHTRSAAANAPEPQCQRSHAMQGAWERNCAWSVSYSGCAQLACHSAGTCTSWYRWESVMLHAVFIRNRDLEEHHKALVSLLLQI